MEISEHLKLEKVSGSYDCFWDKNYSNEFHGELYYFFTNPMNRFIDLYEQFMAQFGYMNKYIIFEAEIHAVRITVNCNQNFDKFGFQQFLMENPTYKDCDKLTQNAAFLHNLLTYNLWFFRMFNDRGIISL